MLWLLLACGVVGFAVGRRAHDRVWLVDNQRRFLTAGLPVLLLLCTAFTPLDLAACLTNAGLYFAAACVFLLACTALSARLRWDIEPTLVGLTATFTNTVMVGIPTFEAVHARDALALVYFIIPLQALVLFAIATLAYVRGGRRWPGANRRQLVPNVTYGLAAGVAIGVLIPHPHELDGVREILVGILQLTSFTVLGTSLGGIRATGGDRRIVGGLVVAKLAVMPAFVYAVFLALRPAHSAAATLIAALPIGINALSYAASTDERSIKYVSRAIFLTTLLAIPSLVLWSCLFGYL